MSQVCCLAVGLLLAASGSVLHIFGTAFPQWESDDVYERGLFEICNDVNDTCKDLKDLSTEDRLAQAFALSGVVTSLLGVFGTTAFVLTSCFGKVPGRLFIVMSGTLLVLSFLCSGACVLYWTLEIHNDDLYDRDVSFYLSSAGAVLLAFGGLFSLSSAMFMKRDDAKV